VCGPNGWVAYQQNKVERRELQTKLDQLRRENDELARHVKGLQSDPRLQEEEARKQGYLRREELAYRPKAGPISASPSSSPCGPLAPNQAGCDEAGSHAGARGTRLIGRLAVVLAFLAGAAACAALRLFWFMNSPSQRGRLAAC
jgi:hypothetical protein